MICSCSIIFVLITKGDKDVITNGMGNNFLKRRLRGFGDDFGGDLDWLRKVGPAFSVDGGDLFHYWQLNRARHQFKLVRRWSFWRLNMALKMSQLWNRIENIFWVRCDDYGQDERAKYARSSMVRPWCNPRGSGQFEDYIIWGGGTRNKKTSSESSSMLCSLRYKRNIQKRHVEAYLNTVRRSWIYL